MKEFKGTPVPWTVDWSDFAVVSKDGKGVADFDYGRFDDDEDCLNAILIAAAPDLLEALQETVYRLDAWISTGRASELDVNAAEKARAAISKALGEE